MAIHHEALARVERRFYLHLVAYFLTVGAMALVSDPDNQLVVVCLAIGWGVLLFLHLAAVFFMPEFRQRLIDGVIERMNRREES